MAKIRTRGASERYGPSTRWFEKGRLYGYGPPYLKVRGLVLYDTDTCDRWFAAHERRSTSEPSRLVEAESRAPAANRRRHRPASKPKRQHAEAR